MRLTVFTGLALAALACADVRLPALISDHMMLQRGVPVRIWGWAAPGENVSVSFQSQKAAAAADSSGKWKVFLKPIVESGPGEMTITGANTITVKDVLAGEVWVASGQSNMEFRVAQADNSEREIATANYSAIRLFLVKKMVSEKPQEDVQGTWVVSSPETVKAHSAVAFFFAREIMQKEHVPVGIIDSYWGGTPPSPGPVCRRCRRIRA